MQSQIRFTHSFVAGKTLAVNGFDRQAVKKALFAGIAVASIAHAAQQALVIEEVQVLC